MYNMLIYQELIFELVGYNSSSSAIITIYALHPDIKKCQWFPTFNVTSRYVIIFDAGKVSLATYCVRTTVRNVADRNGTETSRERENTCRRSGTSRNRTVLLGSESPLGWNPMTSCMLSRWVSLSGRCRRTVCWQSILCSSSRWDWKTKNAQNVLSFGINIINIIGPTEPIVVDLRHATDVQRELQVQLDERRTRADRGDVAVVQLNRCLVVESLDFQQIPFGEKNDLFLSAIN